MDASPNAAELIQTNFGGLECLKRFGRRSAIALKRSVINYNFRNETKFPLARGLPDDCLCYDRTGAVSVVKQRRFCSDSSRLFTICRHQIQDASTHCSIYIQ